MGQKFYFFTDPALLAQQTPAQAYGPQGTVNGKDKFRISSQHPVTGNAPALAICDGMLCVQEDASGTLTLILKPSETPSFEAPQASYYIYRGIKTSSLLSANAIIDETDAQATELTKRIAKAWKDQNGGALANSKNAIGLDRNATFQHPSLGSPVFPFSNNCFVEQLFQYPHPTIQLPIIKAGEKLGEFLAEAKFEVVLHRLGYRPKLLMTRSADYHVEVDDLVTAGNSFKHWHSKEQILAFLDPAAFFGSFVQSALMIVSGGTPSKKSGVKIFEDVLSTFFNNQTAWLDIRGNQAYSYNLFGLYDDNFLDNILQFQAPRDETQTANVDFRRNGWPLLKVELAEIPGKNRRHLRRSSIRIPVGQSRDPAAVLSKGFVKKLAPLAPDERVAPIKKNSPTDAFYTAIKVSFTIYSSGGNDVLGASYTRLNIYEKVNESSAGTAPLHVDGKHYLDGVFRPLDLQLLPDFRESKLRFDIYPEEALVDLEWNAGPTYAASIGIAEDETSVTYFAVPTVEIPNEFGLNGKLSLINWSETLSTIAGHQFFERIAQPFNLTSVKKRTIAPDSAHPNEEIDLLVVRHEPSLEFNPSQDKNNLDDCCFLAVPKAAQQAYISEAVNSATLNPTLPIFLTVNTNSHAQDSANDQAYFETSLQATGFGGTGSSTTRNNQPLTQKVYAYANT
jgi:hypothetical protein